MTELAAHEVALHKVFSSDYEFVIPSYQRPYAWGTEQALELLDDLAEACEHSPQEPYFLGSLVLVKEKGRPRAEVIDGQQRLTTLTILLAVLRDLSETDDLRTRLDDMVRQPQDPLLDIAAKPRVALRSKDADFFARQVQELGATTRLLHLTPGQLETDSQRALHANTRALQRVLAGWSDDRRRHLAQKLASRTYLVAVSTADLDSAHRIFGVMNARGLDLSPADIVKSRVIGAIRDSPGRDSPGTGSTSADSTSARSTSDDSHALAERYAAKWEDAEESIGRDDFADLFLQIRLVESKQRARASLLREFPEQVLSRYLPDRATEFVDDVLVPYARAYQQIRDRAYAVSPAQTSRPGSHPVNTWLSRLDVLDNRDWRAPALWALRTRPGDAPWLDRFFAKLERLAASLYIRRVWTTPRVTRHIELLRQLDAADQHGTDPLDAPAFELTPAERRDTLAVIDGDVYLASKIRKYLLLRLDDTVAGATEVTYQHRVITVEHVLPQNPRAGSTWLESFSDADRARWTHRLANLVLLGRMKNSEAQNYDFERKKAAYFSGRGGAVAFALTSQVLRYPQWNPATLEVRQRELVGLLAREWGLGS
ncbi:DUF262 domain-containing protein [Frondihabitans australicus]|uniref:Uncharacterized protein DUF1524 n=1 Tax=Frondihabitans australicus TaxID=386892 RepID=A0A495ICW3_9MICO|nr:DUF262 domain-containing protein [Frondihabitans australicus]RKR73470.1 uncharacterized protein DUF1524 [Frondihabitans australicus]